MQIPLPIEAIIFDMDGTLVNTEPVHCSAWLEILSVRGYHYDEHWFEQWIGTSDRILAQGVIDEHGLNIKPRELQLEKEKLFHQRVVNEATLFPGVTEALATLMTRLPLAIATNSSRIDAEHVFIPTRLNSYVKEVVTATDVEHLKPAPDMYLLAAKRLGVSPEHCLVVEDSPAGSLAAQRAGMYVLGLTSSQPKQKMSAAHEWHGLPSMAMSRLLELTD